MVESLSGTVQSNGITIAYESSGSESYEVVLLIGGTAQQLIDWPDALVEELVRRRYRVIRIDNRDVGLSTHFTAYGPPQYEAIAQAVSQGKPAPLPYTLTDMANDTVGLLDALGIQSVHLVGASMGGMIAQLVVLDHPEYVNSLTLFATDSDKPGLPKVAKPEVFATLLAQPSGEDIEEFVEYQVKLSLALTSPNHPVDETDIRNQWLRSVKRAYDPVGLARQASVAYLCGVDSAPYRWQNLEKIHVPVIALHGADDPIVPVESSQDIANKISEAELIIFTDLGHELPAYLAPVFANAISLAVSRAKT